MRVPFFVLDVVDNARALGRQQWLLRSIMVIGALLVPLASLGAGSDAGMVTLLLTLALAGWAATQPDSSRPTVLLAALLALWLIQVERPESGWSLLGAVGVLVVHASSAYAAETPGGGRTSAATHRRWAAHTLLVAGATSLVWAVEQILTGAEAQGQALVSGAALVAGATTAVLLTTRSGGWQAEK